MNVCGNVRGVSRRYKNGEAWVSGRYNQGLWKETVKWILVEEDVFREEKGGGEKIEVVQAN